MIGLRIMHCPVIDHWWQTETGWPMCSNPMGLIQPVKGSATFPVPGYDIQVLDDRERLVIQGPRGISFVKLPLRQVVFLALERRWRFRKSYLSSSLVIIRQTGIIDEDGYVFVMGRVDDVINVAGHRLSTGQMEELIGSHPGVAECAVVGIDDELRGQVPVGFAVLKDGVEMNHQDLEKELVSIIRKEIAQSPASENPLCEKASQTRSGKILRKTIRQLAQPQRFQFHPPSMIQPFLMKSVMRCRPVVLGIESLS